MITYRTGDLFKSGADVLVNPVNCVGVMGKGLALQFAKLFPAMLPEYRKACERGYLEVGKVWFWAPVLCVPTKVHWRDNSTIQIIQTSLCQLAYWARFRPELSLAIPPLGCGLGGLQWEVVRPIMIAILSKLPNQIFIYAGGAK